MPKSNSMEAVCWRNGKGCGQHPQLAAQILLLPDKGHHKHSSLLAPVLASPYIVCAQLGHPSLFC